MNAYGMAMEWSLLAFQKTNTDVPARLIDWKIVDEE